MAENFAIAVSNGRECNSSHCLVDQTACLGLSNNYSQNFHQEMGRLVIRGVIGHY